MLAPELQSTQGLCRKVSGGSHGALKFIRTLGRGQFHAALINFTGFNQAVQKFCTELFFGSEAQTIHSGLVG